VVKAHKQEVKKFSFLQGALLGIKDMPCESVNRHQFPKNQDGNNVEKRFVDQVLGQVRTHLKSEESPSWNLYKNLSSDDKKVLTLFWKSLSPKERQEFCPGGHWQLNTNSTPSGALVLAAINGRFEALDILLNSCFASDDIQAEVHKVKGAVYECLNSAHVEAAYQLVKRGFQIPSNESLSVSNSAGRTLAWFAAREDDGLFLKELIERRVDVDVPDQNGWTPLLVAANMGRLSAVKALAQGHLNSIKQDNMEGLVDVSAMDVAGWTPLHRACLHGHPEVADVLISEISAKADIQDYLGRTPLHRATERNQIDVVRMLCKKCKVNPFLEGYVEGYSKFISAIDLAKSRAQESICSILEAYLEENKTGV
jgi:hypothetical protein